MPTFEGCDGTRLFFLDWGEGPPLVFSHGWALGARSWEYQMGPLAARGFRCVAHDRRGSGRSDDPGRGHDFDTWAEDLARLMDALDLRDAVLVGHSMGAGEVVRYVTRHGRRRVRGLVLVAPALPCLGRRPDNPDGLPPEFFDAMVAAVQADRAAVMTGAAEGFVGVGLPGSEASPAQAAWGAGLALEASAHATAAMVRAYAAADFRAELRALDVPCLVVHGDADVEPTTLERCGRPTAAAVPGARLLVYEHAPHGLFVSHRTRLNADLEAFARRPA